MATKQQSFFDKRPPSKGPHQWSHRRPLAPFNNAQQPLPKPTGPAKPIPASSASKSKLGVYRYQSQTKAGSESVLPSDMECVGQENEGEQEQQRNDAIRSSQDGLQNINGNREYPQTPIARIPFADLLNNNQLSIDRSPMGTPIDSVTWKQSPHSSDPRSASSPRGTKRVRSSSPLSASCIKPVYAALNQPDADLDTLDEAQMDPALDIEKRYFSNLKTPSRPPATATAGLGHSSPQTPDLRLDSGGLRRTMSCGIAYPSSKTKRRKLSTSIAPGSQRSPIDNLVKQKKAVQTPVSALLNQIELLGQPERGRNMTKATTASSLPFPAKDKPRQLRPMSMSQPLNTNLVGTKGASFHGLRGDLCAHQTITLGPSQNSRSKSSEYGGDIEMELIDAADATVAVSLDTTMVDKTDQSTQAPQDMAYEARSQEAAGGPMSRPTAPCIEVDDFGDDDDDDDDMFAADLESLAAKFDYVPAQGQDHKAISPRGTVTLHDDEPQAEPTGPSLGVKKRLEVVDLSSDEEYGNDDFADLAEEEITSLAQAAAAKAYDQDRFLLPRFIIKATMQSDYETKNGRKAPEILLHLQEHKTESIKLVALRETWLDSDCPTGAYVHILGQFNQQGLCIIDNSQGFLIIHPDYLLSATVIADAYKCTRRAVLQDRVKATNEANESQIYGHILHEVFQEALQANQWDDAWFQNTVHDVATRYIEGLFELNIRVELAVQHLLGRVKELQSWAELFLKSTPKPDACIKGPNENSTPVAVTKLLDVEEHVWSPRYGLKGNVDATMQITADSGKEQRKLLVPFEIKTGRKKHDQPNISHNSQTALYTLLLSDRYDVQIAFGILYYLETSEMSRITGIRLEIMGMIQKRNELASFVRQRDHLPPMLKNQHTCGHCYAQTACFVYHKLVEDGDEKTSGLGSKFKDSLQHLKPVHAEFFKKWDHLLTKEETDVVKFRKELWTMTSAEREKVGRCFGKLNVKPGSAVDNKAASKINRYNYVFTRPGATASFSFAESQINLGEPIVISDESGHFALANGYVTKIRKLEISVAVDRRLHNARTRSQGFNEAKNQSFSGIMNFSCTRGSQSTMPEESADPVLYRLDKDEFSNGMATVRNNLIRIMESDLFGARFIRRLIIEDVPPAFAAPPSTLMNHLERSRGDLNVDQMNAINKVMEAQDYALVLGMPGTGKTTTIAHIIRALVASGKSVLLTSYTHTAVDNILLKIRHDNLSILRIGAEAKIHPDIAEFADLASTPKETFEELERCYSSQVVATTCLGINHPIFNQRTFDYCIVDEASQITLPVCLGPIRMAHRFVLVGDHYQLPPLVQNKDAQEGGLDVSLFKLLSDRHPESVVNLEHQYRMCEEIMSLSNSLIYSGRLKCGTFAVAKRSIEIPNMAALKQHHHTALTVTASQSAICTGPGPACWLRDMLSPSRHVVFINTDPLKTSAREIAHGSRVTNPLEVVLATQIVRSFLTVGIDASEIGMITLYRSQLSLLKQSLRVFTGNNNAAGAGSVEMHTADKFQGRDKEVVVLSLVRSNENNNVGDLLQDWRRVNVALTRARTKLVIMGSWETIRNGSDLLGRLCSLVEERGWKYDLKKGALDEHWFDDLGTQVSRLPLTEAEDEEKKVPNHYEDKSLKSKGAKAVTRVPDKTGRLNTAKLFKSRPVLQDIMNEMTA